MSGRHRLKKFWRSFFILFIIYLLVIPALYFILDAEQVTKSFNEDPFMFILKMAGIAAGISFIIAFWTRRDPELKKY
ncbi:MAG: hypothetical protein U0U70_07475 [Chitinophagaceae bacterium]